MNRQTTLLNNVLEFSLFHIFYKRWANVLFDLTLPKIPSFSQILLQNFFPRIITQTIRKILDKSIRFPANLSFFDVWGNLRWNFQNLLLFLKIINFFGISTANHFKWKILTYSHLHYIILSIIPPPSFPFLDFHKWRNNFCECRK